MRKFLCITILLTVFLSGCGNYDEPADSVSEETTEYSTEAEETTSEPTEEITTQEITTEPETEAPTEKETEAVTNEKTEPVTEEETETEYETENSGGMVLVKETNKVFSSVNTEDSPWRLSVGVDSLNAAKTLTADKSGYYNVLYNDYFILGTIVDIESRYEDEISKAVIRFNIADEYTDNVLNKYSDLDEFKGIRRLNIFKYFEDMNMALPIDTEFDGNIIYAEVDELGTYYVGDMELWLDNLGVEMDE